MSQPSEVISLIPSASPSAYWTDRPFIPEAVQKRVEPYLLPYDHPIREKLDAIYANRDQLDIISQGQDVKVYSHESLDGYIIKIGNIIGQKHTKLLRRVEGHHAANQLIEEKNYTHVKVTRNWLYPVPGNGGFFNWLVHYATRPARFALKHFKLKAPEWLKYADIILKERFIIVEERVRIAKPTLEQLNACDIALIDEYIDVALEVGFQDAHKSNYCFDASGRLVLFDLGEYPSKKEKRATLGEWGVRILLSASVHKDYALRKLASFLQNAS